MTEKKRPDCTTCRSELVCPCSHKNQNCFKNHEKTYSELTGLFDCGYESRIVGDKSP